MTRPAGPAAIAPPLPRETPAAEPDLLPGAWMAVGLIFFVAMFNYLDRMTITTMHGSLTAAIPMSEKQFGLLTSGFYFVYGCLSPFAGYLSDRYSRKWVLVGSLLWWSALTLVTAYARTFGELLATRMLMGASEACAMPAGLALIADYHRGRTRSLATGIHMCGIEFGVALSGVGGWLAATEGWSFAFGLFGTIGLAYGILLCFFLRDAPGGPSVEVSGLVPPAPARLGPTLAALFRTRNFIFVLLYWGLLGIIGGSMTGWLPTYFSEHFHLSQSRAGFYSTTFLQPGTFIGLLLSGIWADRWSRTHPRGRILVPVIALCVAAPAILLASNTTLIAVAMIALFVSRLTKAASDSNMMPILCMIADPRSRATGYGVLNLLSCSIISVTIFIGGALRDAGVGIEVVYDVGALLFFVCAGFLWLVKPAQAGKE